MPRRRSLPFLFPLFFTDPIKQKILFSHAFLLGPLLGAHTRVAAKCFGSWPRSAGDLGLSVRRGRFRMHTTRGVRINRNEKQSTAPTVGVCEPISVCAPWLWGEHEPGHAHARALGLRNRPHLVSFVF
ncbi:hypothetical protein TW95_gp1117 [Pandoravirus inopinatum]|uniref:Uncharacterized protein n=1 Tax=Pandoravirus inopinatum TaxID=1605721 RepID=A0A0B5JAB2_9VIRU|nr:hypothetical protein TW95_gp1117 [Pandoravirus inopinatum]AJF97851.1 hypothetical protein [Pandoravirus inopinatum]